MKKFSFLILIFLFFPFHSVSEEIFLSLKKNKVYVRYGPSLQSPIKYVYKKINFPIKQIDKKENFRRIIDFKNNSGWIHLSQLKKVNSIIPLESKILFSKASHFSKPLAKIMKGRVLILKKCKGDWCKVKTEEYRGWVTMENTWGPIN